MDRETEYHFEEVEISIDGTTLLGPMFGGIVDVEYDPESLAYELGAIRLEGWRAGKAVCIPAPDYLDALLRVSLDTPEYRKKITRHIEDEITDEQSFREDCRPRLTRADTLRVGR